MSKVRFSNEATSLKNVGALTSYEALVAGGDKTKEVLMRKKEKSFNKVMCLVLKEQLQQRLSGIHLQAVNDRFLYIPTMLITLLSAAISILLTSELIETQEAKIKLGIAVAFLQLILSIVQSLSNQLNLGGRAGFHKSAARSLKDMYLQATSLRDENRHNAIYKAIKQGKRLSIGANSLDEVKINFDEDEDDEDDETKNDETENKTEKAKGSPEPKKRDETNGKDREHEEKHDGTDETTTLTGKFKQSIEQVDSQVPLRLSSAFDVMEHRISIINKSLLTNKSSSLISWEKLMPALYHQLSETIIESWGWPLFLPSPRHCVEKALKDFKKLLDVDKDNNADLLMTLLDRADDISNAQTRLWEVKKKREKERKNIERSFYSDDIPNGESSNNDAENRAIYGYEPV